MIKNNGRIRTADLFEFFKLESKKQRLYMNYETDGAEGETRTLTPKHQNLNLARLPISPLPQKKKKWGERWDSNPRQPESQSGALPTELLSPPCDGVP